MKKEQHTALRLWFLISASVVLLGCASIQSPPMTVNTSLPNTSAFIGNWVIRTFRQKATMFGGDAVAYEYIPDGHGNGRIELRWSAPDLPSRLVFAVIRLKQVAPSRVEISITEEKNNVPLMRKFQDVHTKLRAELQRAGYLVR